MLQNNSVSSHLILVCGYQKNESHPSPESVNYVKYLNVKCLTCIQGGLKMDKQAEAFADLIKQAFPSPLEQAFKDWRATTRKIKEKQNNEK